MFHLGQRKHSDNAKVHVHYETPYIPPLPLPPLQPGILKVVLGFTTRDPVRRLTESVSSLNILSTDMPREAVLFPLLFILPEDPLDDAVLALPDLGGAEEPSVHTRPDRHDHDVEPVHDDLRAEEGRDDLEGRGGKLVG